MKLGQARKGHIPSSMMKTTADFCEISLSIVTCRCQKTSPTPYEIGTCSYGSYTKLNDENYNRFFWNIIIVHSNLTPPKNVPHPVWNWDMLVWVIYQAHVVTVVTNHKQSVVTHHKRSIVTNHKRTIVTNFPKNTSPLRWGFGGNKQTKKHDFFCGWLMVRWWQ